MKINNEIGQKWASHEENRHKWNSQGKTGQKWTSQARKRQKWASCSQLRGEGFDPLILALFEIAVLQYFTEIIR